MSTTYVVLGISALMFGATAVLALAWALRKGQLENFQRGATSIFDADEPVGRPTDFFPGGRPR
ncbi:MAG: cbb3-type cytochrome oxidase assembly protein CcoS [Planctomycetota bacterium]|nr:cbb3-type cytochrome oxidase assembly protein CcoS [Planctomycetota bacterium]